MTDDDLTGVALSAQQIKQPLPQVSLGFIQVPQSRQGLLGTSIQDMEGQSAQSLADPACFGPLQREGSTSAVTAQLKPT